MYIRRESDHDFKSDLTVPLDSRKRLPVRIIFNF